MNMIERVARALCIANGHDPDMTYDVHVPGDPVAGQTWAGYRREARAAIEAMRTPTDEMIKAAHDTFETHGTQWNGRAETIAPSAPIHMFNAMLNAALSEGKEGE